MKKISFDAQSTLVNGQRTLLLSGAMHYLRSSPAMWPELMRRSKDAGLNTIETVTFWAQHESMRGRYDFTGRLDLRRFLECAHAEGLLVYLRPGPYICAEHDFGGFPLWLRNVPGIQFRTFNQPFMDETRRWFDVFFAYLRPMLYSQGGPIAFVQVENEYKNIAADYGKEGSRYLAWLRDLFESYDLGVPLTMCNPACSIPNDFAEGWTERTIPTINAGLCVEQVNDFKKSYPELPVLWTEAWMSWYQIWGGPRPARTASNLVFYVARFFAEGGKGINYYMWHGGTNFARESMFLQATSYDFDAPLNEFGQTTKKFDALRAFHSLLREHEAFFLENDLPEKQTLKGDIAVRKFRHAGREVVILANDTFLYQNVPPVAVTWGEFNTIMPSESMVWLLDGQVIWRCDVDNTPEPAPDVFTPLVKINCIETMVEPFPTTGLIERAQPEDQLLHTHNQSDYCWYLTDLSVASAGLGELTFSGLNDFAQIFINGAYVARTSEYLKEDRGLWDGPDYKQRFQLELPAGTHRLAVLCSALGLVKGDWQAGKLNMTTERKGLWGAVHWNGIALPGPWQHRPFLDGEIAGLAGCAGSLAQWHKGESSDAVSSGLRWFRLTFDAPVGDAPIALDLAGLGKGLVWVNGECLGRYWLIRIRAQKDKHLEHEQGLLMDESASDPTQRYYHLPREWVRPGCNEIILFEETGGDPRSVQVCAWSRA